MWRHQISPVSVVTLFGDYLAFTVTVLVREASAGYRRMGAKAAEPIGAWDSLMAAAQIRGFPPALW